MPWSGNFSLHVGNSAYHTALGEQSVGRHPLVTRFIHSMRTFYALKWNCHFMVWRLPARPSQLPDWYNSGVCAGLFLRRVNSLHLEGLRGGNSAFHTSLGGQSVGRHPLVTHFLCGALRLRSPVRPVVLQAFCPPFGSLTSKSITVCVQCEHWMHTSTKLPCGEGRTNY